MVIGKQQSTAKNPSSRLPRLDGVRGAAILLVVVWHYVANTADPQSPLVQLLSMTWSGVDLFFVLSGFLIGGILIDHRSAPHYFKAFYMRRIARILPLYFLWLALFVGITTFVPAVFSGALKSSFENPFPNWAYFLFVQNILIAASPAGTMGAAWLGSTWSLAVEEQFYLVLPAMIWLFSPRKLPYALVTFITAAPLLRILMAFVNPPAAFPNYVLMPTRADALLIGVFCAYALRQDESRLWLMRHPRTLYAAFAVLFAGVVALSLLSLFTRQIVLNLFGGYTWVALFYACFLVIAVTTSHGIIAWLSSNIGLRCLGILAYGVYLFHDPVNRAAHALLLNQEPHLSNFSDLYVTLGAFGLTLALAALSWHFFEKRILAWGHSFEYS